MSSNSNYWNAVLAARGSRSRSAGETLSRPQGIISAGTSANVPALATSTVVSSPPVAPSQPSAIKRSVGFPKGKKRGSEGKALGPDAKPGGPVNNKLATNPRMPVSGAIKRGLPTVSHAVGLALESYGSMEQLEAQIRHLNTARQLIRRGFTDPSTINVLAKPGSLAGAPTVGKVDDATKLSPAEESALGTTVGTVPQTPDPRTALELKKSRATTSREAVSSSTMAAGMALGGDQNSVPSTQAPSVPALVGALQQLPTKINEEIDGEDTHDALPIRSLFRKSR